jgi:hypothetical protein
MRKKPSFKAVDKGPSAAERRKPRRFVHLGLSELPTAGNKLIVKN